MALTKLIQNDIVHVLSSIWLQRHERPKTNNDGLKKARLTD